MQRSRPKVKNKRILQELTVERLHIEKPSSEILDGGFLCIVQHNCLVTCIDIPAFLWHSIYKCLLKGNDNGGKDHVGNYR